MSELSPRAERFAREYPVDLNITLAAIRAGFSQRTAASQGSRLLKDVKVQAAIQQWRKKIADKTDVTKERVLSEYAKVGFKDIEEPVTWGDKIRALDAIRKMLGFDAPTELSGPGGGPIEVAEVSSTELARRMAFALIAATAKDVEA